VIGISAALFSKNEHVRDRVVQVCEQFDAVQALGELCRSRADGPGEIVALPKADSSREFADFYESEYGLTIGSGDRFLAAQVLEPGEMLFPRQAEEYVRLQFGGKFDDGPAGRLTQRLDRELGPLREAARENLLQVTYVKPEGADTVIKVEFRGGTLEVAQRIGRVLSDETPGPHLQEPFAQHMADLAAKSVSAGAQAVNSAMLGHLPATAAAYLPYLARSYRT
jgi:hypothetical protein